MGVYTYKISVIFDTLAEIRERLHSCNNIEDFEKIEKEYNYVMLNNKRLVIDHEIHDEIIKMIKRKIVEGNNGLEG